ncbi:solute carrier organic anion transporter, partial [Cellulomonas massiliensis]|uniref:solute carrier organic anion transporter n=1 Tax=Cellulomonas massiliensis TaxID=1465811 RepID=UPI001375E6C0
MSRPDLYANPEPYHAPGWQPAAPPLDPVSVASLVTGVLGLGPVALGLGVGGLVRTRPAARPPR